MRLVNSLFEILDQFLTLIQGLKAILKLSVLSIQCDFFKNAIFLIAFTNFKILFTITL